MNENYSNINDTTLYRYLEESTSAQEKTQVENWIESSDTNRAQFEEVKKIWELSTITEDFEQLDTDTSWNSVQQRILEKEGLHGKKSKFSMLWKVAAVLILLFSVSIPFLYNRSTTLVADSTKEFVLPDNSQVWLKKGSQLTYHKTFNDATREVALEGEGYFIVKKNKEKPFSIQLGPTTTTVLGTEFNLKKQDQTDMVSLTLIEGSVQFANDKESKLIKPGETITTTSNGKLSVSSTSNPNVDSWRTKILKFEQTELSQVIQNIVNTYDTKIEIANKELLSCKLTATFEKQSIDEVIEALVLLYQFSVEKEANVIRLTNGRCTS
ncbi:FecR domain-containing protein [Aquimarina sp. ERC-38]|uniref:FecR family protein n=1 Tax=Aquimarina sp. ERC-38 TaxID=2949996 RepID=UPI002245BDE8|nr:FecR domain-containing protein [Aquimarina sp. ERC-38]UZO80145.1 FecR domain-containing protein [Aquimarina sp. ERC-38]